VVELVEEQVLVVVEELEVCFFHFVIHVLQECLLLQEQLTQLQLEQVLQPQQVLEVQVQIQ
tara:strand:+ start:624 stop:806 length:183 start_codon:yes stop_codon:yes gene_type:complete